MNRVVLVTRHAQSCNNAARPHEKFMEPLLTRYGVTSAIDRSLLEKFNDEGKLTGDYLYNSDIVYVSCLVRTWLTALILYNANQETPKPVFTLRVIPDLKEKHKHPSLPGNYPLKLKVSLTLFITFLNNLPEQDSGSIRGLIDKLPTRIKIEIYRSDTRSQTLEITFKKNAAAAAEPEPEPEPDLDLDPEPDGHLYSVDCDSTTSALNDFPSDPLTGDEGHIRIGNIQETVMRLNQGNYNAGREADDIIHVVSHNEIMRKCLRRFHVNTYKQVATRELSYADATGSPLPGVDDDDPPPPPPPPQAALEQPAAEEEEEDRRGVTLYESRKTGDKGSFQEPSPGAIEELKEGNMFSIEFKFESLLTGTIPKLSKIYNGVEFTGDTISQYIDSIQAGLCIYEKSPSYLPIQVNCTHYKGPYKAKLIRKYLSDKDVFVICRGPQMTVYSDRGQNSEALFTRQISSSTSLDVLKRDGGELARRTLSVTDSITMEKTKLIFDNPDDRERVYEHLTQIRDSAPPAAASAAAAAAEAASRSSTAGGGMLKKKRKSKHKSKPKSKPKSKRKRKSKPKRKSKRKTRKR